MAKSNFSTTPHGHWQPLEKAGPDASGRMMWLCECKCGTIKPVLAYLLRSGKSKSCGCSYKIPFSTLPIRYWQPLRVDPNKGSRWICQCRCGTIKSIRVQTLMNGQSQSCGCYRRSKAAQQNLQHGMHRSAEYKAWQAMKLRCHTTTNVNYQNYGGRGIVVCERWRNSFVNFYEDMGPRPSPSYSLERKDNDGIYEPDNCKWATRKEQSNNTRAVVHLSYQGQTKSISEWARITKILFATLRARLQRGWSVEEALSTPVDTHHVRWTVRRRAASATP